MPERAAGLSLRVRAFLWDYPIVAAYLVLVVGAGAAFQARFPHAAHHVFGSAAWSQFHAFLVVTLPVTLYFALFERSRGQATPGKRRMRLRVERWDGRRLGLARSLGRTALKFLPWELAHACIWQVRFAAPESQTLVSAGFVLVWVLVGANAWSLLADPARRTLYDRVLGTRVVTFAQDPETVTDRGRSPGRAASRGRGPPPG